MLQALRSRLATRTTDGLGLNLSSEELKFHTDSIDSEKIEENEGGERD